MSQRTSCRYTFGSITKTRARTADGRRVSEHAVREGEIAPSEQLVATTPAAGELPAVEFTVSAAALYNVKTAPASRYENRAAGSPLTQYREHLLLMEAAGCDDATIDATLAAAHLCEQLGTGRDTAMELAARTTLAATTPRPGQPERVMAAVHATVDRAAQMRRAPLEERRRLLEDSYTTNSPDLPPSHPVHREHTERVQQLDRRLADLNRSARDTTSQFEQLLSR